VVCILPLNFKRLKPLVMIQTDLRKEFPKRIRSEVLIIFSTFGKRKVLTYMVFVHAGRQGNDR
jgi:hypothetical protein